MWDRASGCGAGDEKSMIKKCSVCGHVTNSKVAFRNGSNPWVMPCCAKCNEDGSLERWLTDHIAEVLRSMREMKITPSGDQIQK